MLYVVDPATNDLGCSVWLFAESVPIRQTHKPIQPWQKTIQLSSKETWHTKYYTWYGPVIDICACCINYVLVWCHIHSYPLYNALGCHAHPPVPPIQTMWPPNETSRGECTTDGAMEGAKDAEMETESNAPPVATGYGRLQLPRRQHAFRLTDGPSVQIQEVLKSKTLDLFQPQQPKIWNCHGTEMAKKGNKMKNRAKKPVYNIDISSVRPCWLRAKSRLLDLRTLKEMQTTLTISQHKSQ